MKRVQSIYEDELYVKHLNDIQSLELDRIYCHHDMNHFLDVARIASVIAYEENIEIPKDIIYAAAILHDIGRDVQYKCGQNHEEASATIAPEILKRAGYNNAEIDCIVEAIKEHGNIASIPRKDLVGIIYRADKLSRKCFCCDAVATCHKAEDKRNMTIKV